MITVNGSVFAIHGGSGEPLWLQPSPHNALLHDNRDPHERIRSATACTIDPTDGSMYIFKFDNRTNMFMVVGGLNDTISKLVRAGWTNGIIDNTEVVITTNKRDRFFAMDAANGATDWMEKDGDAVDGSIEMLLPIHGTRTEYSLHVFNASTGRNEVLCDFSFADYSSPNDVTVPFLTADPHLSLRRSAKVLYLYHDKLRRKLWEREFPDDIAHVLRPVARRKSHVLHRVLVEFGDAHSPSSDLTQRLALLPAITDDGTFYLMPTYSAPRGITHEQPSSGAVVVVEDADMEDRPWGFFAELIERYPMTPIDPSSLPPDQPPAPIDTPTPTPAPVPAPPPPPPLSFLQEHGDALVTLVISIVFAGVVAFVVSRSASKPLPQPNPAPTPQVEPALVPNPPSSRNSSGSIRMIPSDHILSVSSTASLPRTQSLDMGEPLVIGRFRDVGSLRIDLEAIIGHGSHGTSVYIGEFEKQKVAVKCIVKHQFALAEAELDSLLKVHHKNVIRFFYYHASNDFVYIALQFCIANLEQMVTRHSLPVEVQAMLEGLDRKRLLLGMFKGLAEIHALNLVHRDIKPHNILITPELNAVISDFGLSKILPVAQSSFTDPGHGTRGWSAPEVQFSVTTRSTRAVDMFSSGLVAHYVTYAIHPFDPPSYAVAATSPLYFIKREQNIHDANYESVVQTDQIDFDFVTALIAHDAKARLSAKEALLHPFFWPVDRRMHFLLDVSDRLETEVAATSVLLATLETFRQDACGFDWRQVIDPPLYKDMCDRRSYKNTFAQLLRAFRNKKHHYHEMDQPLKDLVGSMPHGYFAYFHTRFPMLFMACYRFVRASNLHLEHQFRGYYDTDQ